MNTRNHVLWLSTFLMALSGSAQAHKFSDSYLQLDTRTPNIALTWDIALRDLDQALGLDVDQDGKLTWGEIKRQRERIERYALGRIALHRGTAACNVAADELLIDHHSDGAYAVLRMHAPCVDTNGPLALTYNLLFEIDPQHRGIVSLAGSASSYVLGPDQRQVALDESAHLDASGAASFFRDGVWHIVTGYDHLLFLVTLLVPAVLVRERGSWRAVEHFRSAFMATARIVTAFTIAHSVTLALAATGTVTLPSRWVESAIALSVILAALNNIRPVVTERRWMAALVFGLIHGFGFAAVLSEADMERAGLLWSLGAFNVGVEAGQLAVVALFMPLAYAARNARVYRQRAVPLASSAAAALGAVWLVQRIA